MAYFRNLSPRDNKSIVIYMFDNTLYYANIITI